MSTDPIPFYDLAAEHATLRPALDAAYHRVMDSGAVDTRAGTARL